MIALHSFFIKVTWIALHSLSRLPCLLVSLSARLPSVYILQLGCQARPSLFCHACLHFSARSSGSLFTLHPGSLVSLSARLPSCLDSSARLPGSSSLFCHACLHSSAPLYSSARLAFTLRGGHQDCSSLFIQARLSVFQPGCQAVWILQLGCQAGPLLFC